MKKLFYLIRVLFGAVRFCGTSPFKFKLTVIKGEENIVKIGEKTVINHPELIISGKGNKLTIGKNVIMGPGCKIFLQGNNCSIKIGDNCTFTRIVELNAQEDNSEIIIGNDCMFSNHIIVRTSDSHPIFDNITKERINTPKSVIIGDHVWIAPNSKIMKGANIGMGAIIGSDTTITKNVPNNALCIGRPCKIIRENVEWSRENLF